MPIQLGQDPWILITLTFLEILLILIPALISSKIEKKSLKESIVEMGFRKNEDTLSKKVIKILSGIILGLLFYFIAGPMLNFFTNIVVNNLFGTIFVKEGMEKAINTNPINPTFLQTILIIIMHLLIVGPCEEGCFRGFLLKKFRGKFKAIHAVVFSSLLFTVYHVPPFLVPISTIITFFFYYFIFGILLALVCVSFDYSLIPSSVAHSLLNVLIILL